MLTTSGIDVRSDLLGELTRRGRFAVAASSFDFTDPSCGLLSGATQVAFTVGPIEHPDLTGRVLYTEPRHFVMSAAHPLASAPEIRREDVDRFPACALENQAREPMVHHWSDFWQLQPAMSGLRRPAAWIGRDLEAWLAAVAGSDGISSCPASFATLYRRPDLVYRETTEIEPCEHLLLHRLDQSDTALVVEVLALADSFTPG